MAKQPFFTAIIPTHNRADRLPEAVGSVLAQTFDDFEAVIVDNGSTDETKSVVRQLQKKDSRIRYFWQKNSGAPAGSRNSGIRQARGRYIAFLDSDDIWLPRKLEVIAQKAKSLTQGMAFFYHDYFSLNDHGIRKEHSSRELHSLAYEDLLTNGNCIGCLTAVIDRKALSRSGGFDERPDFLAVEDYDLWLRLARFVSFHHIAQPLAEYRVHSGGLSAHLDRQLANLQTVIETHLAKAGDPELALKARVCLARQQGLAMLHAGRFRGAIPPLERRNTLQPGAKASILLAIAKIGAKLPWLAKPLWSTSIRLLELYRGAASARTGEV